MASKVMKAFQEEPHSKLVAATKTREGEPFEFLAKRHETQMFAVAFRITRNREDAQDVLQQSLYKAFVHLDAFEGKSSFSTWLTRIVINEALMWLRKNRTRSEVSLEDLRSGLETPFPTEIRDPSDNPAEIYGQHETQRILSQAIKQLGSQLGTALRLRLEDRTLEETAEILGVGIGTLKARLFRGRQKLRVLLGLHSTPIGSGKKRMRCDLNRNSRLPNSGVSCG